VVPLEKEKVFFGREGVSDDDYAYGATYAEAGFSLAKGSFGDVLLGTPGAWNWTGTVTM